MAWRCGWPLATVSWRSKVGLSWLVLAKEMLETDPAWAILSTPKQDKNFVEKLVQRIVDNIEINLSDIHFR